ncbi:LysR family transcriptional regulator [Albirhodobacter sp. R86504]|uniref:LysR family transcriptional regulator n=1 Tax=Albirhodobacter sp. R86504 TaxID=3093848 RepID=UPI00366AF841
MSPPELARFDLNLIKVFLAIWEAGNLTTAGERLGLTQPAVSHALRRLRDQFSDPLFQRVGNQMVPTKTAIRLQGSFHKALSLLDQTMQESRVFTPETTTRRFKIAMTDTGEFFSMPAILSAVEKAAPFASINSVRVDPVDMPASLRSGLVDLAIAYLPGVDTSRCDGRVLIEDRMVCLMRAGHPALAGEWTESSFAALSFVDVSHAATGYQLARTALAKRGHSLNARATLDHFTVVPEVVRQTDFVAIFPQSIFLRLQERGGFEARDLPFNVPSFEVKLWNHASFAADPALIWLRTLIYEVLAAR